MIRRVALAIAALVALAMPARAIILFEASGGWNTGTQGGELHQDATSPQTAGSIIPNPCDGTGTNYLCFDYFGRSELLQGGRVVFRARSALVVKNFTTQFQSGKLSYGGARGYFYQVGYAAGSTPGAFAYFHFALHGTRSESTTSPQATIVAQGNAYLSADTQRYVQCVADVCAPIKVPITPGGWNPGDPFGTAFIVDLRTDTTIGVPANVTLDAAAFADFASTLELLAIEIKDADDVTIPGSQLVVNDAMGDPMFVIPSEIPVTTTTLPGVTTTTSLPGGTVTTTTLAGSTSTTTTTLPGGTVTTTTLPAACPTGASFASVHCRLATLVQAVQAAASGAVESKLVGKLSSVQQAVAEAEQVATTNKKQAAKKIGKALHAIRAFKLVLKGRSTKRALTEDVRAALSAPLAGLKADLKALKN